MSVAAVKIAERDVNQMIADGNFPEARRELDEALKQYPGTLSLELLSGKILERNNETATATEHYRRLGQQFPDSAAVHRALFRLALTEGQYEEAEQQLRLAQSKGLADDVASRMSAQLEAKQHDEEAGQQPRLAPSKGRADRVASRMSPQLEARQPKQTQGRRAYGGPNAARAVAMLARQARQAISDGKFNDAAQFIGQAEQFGLDAAMACRLRLHIAIKRQDQAGRRECLQKLRALEPEDRVEILLSLAQLCLQERDYSECIALAEEVLADNTWHPVARELLINAAISSGDVERVEKEFASMSQEEADDPLWYHLRKKLYTQSGRVDLAVDLVRGRWQRRKMGVNGLITAATNLPLPADLMALALKGAGEISASAPDGVKRHAAELLLRSGMTLPTALADISATVNEGQSLAFDWLADAPKDSELQRPLVVDNGIDDILIARAAQSKATVLVFSGLADRGAMPRQVLDRYFSALGLTAVYLRDPSRVMYNAGISSVAPDYAGTLDYLRKLGNELGSAPLVTFGTSAGAAAAIRYGMDLGASCTFAFSPPTSLTIESKNKGRAGIIQRRLRELPPDARDMLPVVQRANGKTPLHLAYCEENTLDTQHALHLKDEPGVILHPLSGTNAHASIVVMAQENRLLPFIKECLQL